MKHEIKVSSKTHVNALAGCIIASFDDGKEPLVVAIGPAAVAQAVKAVFVANKHFAKVNKIVCIVPEMRWKEILDEKTGTMVEWVITTLELLDVPLSSLRCPPKS